MRGLLSSTSPAQSSTESSAHPRAAAGAQPDAALVEESVIDRDEVGISHGLYPEQYHPKQMAIDITGIDHNGLKDIASNFHCIIAVYLDHGWEEWILRMDYRDDYSFDAVFAPRSYSEPANELPLVNLLQNPDTEVYRVLLPILPHNADDDSDYMKAQELIMCATGAQPDLAVAQPDVAVAQPDAAVAQPDTASATNPGDECAYGSTTQQTTSNNHLTAYICGGSGCHNLEITTEHQQCDSCENEFCEKCFLKVTNRCDTCDNKLCDACFEDAERDGCPFCHDNDVESVSVVVDGAEDTESSSSPESQLKDITNRYTNVKVAKGQSNSRKGTIYGFIANSGTGANK